MEIKDRPAVEKTINSVLRTVKNPVFVYFDGVMK